MSIAAQDANDSLPITKVSRRSSDSRLPRRALRRILALDDFEAPARRYIPRPIFGYVRASAEREDSLIQNRAAYAELAFVPRTLVDTSARSQETTLFGKTYASPFGVAPMGGISLAAYQGDIVMARSTAAANIPMILSGGALTPLEKVRQAGPTAWFQAYLPGDDEIVARLVDRVARAGYETMAVTLDTPVSSNLEYALRRGWRKPFRPSPRFMWDLAARPRWLVGMLLRTLVLHGMPHVENMGPRSPMISRTLDRPRGGLDRLGWHHIELIRKLWNGNLVLKGVLNKDDARTAREAGVDGVIVSNHGGRQLDGAIAPLRVLAGIVAEAGDMTIMIDSGIRRGTDVLKALALGARFCFIGRPFLYAAAIAGDAGVAHAIGLLQSEIRRDMAFLGVASLDEVTRGRLVRADSFDGLGPGA
jgi:L-lactate dehydrogenase (cytochrome)